MPEVISLASRLKQQLQLIENQMMELLDASTIEEFRNDPRSEFFVAAPDYYWGETDAHQKSLQMQLKNTYSIWFEHFHLLFNNAPDEMQRQIEQTHKFVTDWIEKKSDWDIQPTIPQNKSKFKEKIQAFCEFIRMIDNPTERTLILVPDTNALIKAPDISQYSKVVGQDNYTIVFVPTVLKELDELKVRGRDSDFRDKVASVIRRIKGLRQQGSLLEGVIVNKTVTAKMIAQEPNFNETLHWLDSTNNDDRIIASVLEIQRANPSATVVLVTSDINHQNKAEMANLPFLEPPEGDKVD